MRGWYTFSIAKYGNDLLDGEITNWIGRLMLLEPSKARDNVVACGRLSLSQQSYSQWETSEFRADGF